ncbi:MAG: PTS sugar transporter subunit IIA, partial [Candidatus Omnitrophica bacterium]|nr:PTS sugar transporter subunit IIA [Candidatus Omnitrophota bacterium]
MKISELVQKNLVTANLKSHTAEGVISEIVDHLYKLRKIRDKKQILASLLKRETLGSTGIGEGIAIPHARIAELKEAVLFVGLSRHGINFSSVDGKPVYLVVFFLTPLLESELHLKILAKVAGLLDNKVLLRQLMRCKTSDELFQVIVRGGTEREGFIALTKEEIYLELRSSDNGISDVSAAKRLEVYGPNKLKAIRKTPL